MTSTPESARRRFHAPTSSSSPSSHVTPGTLCPPLLVAGIPHLLGFWPEESLIVVALSTDPRHPIVATLRVDLPAPGAASDRNDLLDWLPQPLLPAVRLCDSLVAIVWSHRSDETHDTLIHDVVRVIDGIGAPVADGLVVTTQGCDHRSIRWRSALCGDPVCCPDDGLTVADRDRTRAPQVVRASASRPAPSRADLERELQPAAGERREWSPEPEVREPISPEAFEVAVSHAVSLLRSGGPVRIEDARLLARALSDVRVRDTVLWEVLTHRRPRWAVAAQALAQVVRSLPDHLQAPTATCLGILRWQLGDGARAMIAIERALDADAQYSLAQLVAGCLTGGVPPADWRSGICALRREDLTGCA